MRKDGAQFVVCSYFGAVEGRKMAGRKMKEVES
jgi:hypothetical protein